MKIISLIISIISNAYSFNFSPNLFGSKDRREAKSDIATEFKTSASETQDEIDTLKSQNPFESAASKSAMASASRNAKQMSTRMYNTMGAGATAEALIAGQGATTEALGAATGQIAVGAEAQKAQDLARLRGEKAGEMASYAGMKSASEDERGSGWNTLFQSIDSLGKLASGVGAAKTAFTPK